KGQETFAETGFWNQPYLERALARLLETAPGRLWYGYHVSAGDDCKVHRCSPDVWGTCTFHEYTARCPNRATTVRAHNWVVCGAFLHNPDRPAWFLPQAGRLYFRKSPLPRTPEPEVFHTKCALLVDLFRQEAAAVGGRHLGVFDGGFAYRSVVRPLAVPPAGQPRIDFLTRLRHDARLYELPPPARAPGRRGRKPKWGRRLPPPRRGGQWRGPWQGGGAVPDRRRRPVRWKEVVCLWRVLGHEVPVKAVVAEVEGYKRRFTLVSSAVDLSGLRLLELFGARFRQEDGFRDLKQRLGWEEGRAWTKQPILRTTQAELITMTLLRLVQLRLEAAGETDWWLRPPWNRYKGRPSILDLERLLRRHTPE